MLFWELYGDRRIKNFDAQVARFQIVSLESLKRSQEGIYSDLDNKAAQYSMQHHGKLNGSHRTVVQERFKELYRDQRNKEF